MFDYVVYHQNMFVNRELTKAYYRPLGTVRAQNTEMAMKLAKQNYTSPNPVLERLLPKIGPMGKIINTIDQYRKICGDFETGVRVHGCEPKSSR